MIGTIATFFCVFITLASLYIGARFKRDTRGNIDIEPTPGSAVRAIATVIVVWMCRGAVGQVDEGERGVVLRFGAATGRVIEPGAYFVTPFVESVNEVSVRTEAEAVKAEGASKDLQVVHAEITVNYSLDPTQVVEVYRTLRGDALHRVIRPAIEEAVKAGTAEYKAEELITHRAAVKEAISEILRKRLTARGYLLDAINVTDFDFSETFNRSIEEKVTATQSALKAQNDLERVKAEAQQSVARAEAEAAALKAQAGVVTPELIRLRQVEAQLKAVEKWDGRLPTFVGGGEAPVPMLDVFSASKAK